MVIRIQTNFMPLPYLLNDDPPAGVKVLIPPAREQRAITVETIYEVIILSGVAAPSGALTLWLLKHIKDRVVRMWLDGKDLGDVTSEDIKNLLSKKE